jgi:hypothetical protein
MPDGHDGFLGEVEVNEITRADPGAPRVLFAALQAAIDAAAKDIDEPQWFQIGIQVQVSPNPGPTAYKVKLGPPGS